RDLHLSIRRQRQMCIRDRSMAILAGGSIKISRTTPLMSLNDGMEAMEKASKLGYKPPGNF
ncbi:hypothetical protein DU79_08470, partial [Methanosarcina mazei]